MFTADRTGAGRGRLRSRLGKADTAQEIARIQQLHAFDSRLCLCLLIVLWQYFHRQSLALLEEFRFTQNCLFFLSAVTVDAMKVDASLQRSALVFTLIVTVTYYVFRLYPLHIFSSALVQHLAPDN